jgi:hypothetical protein
MTNQGSNFRCRQGVSFRLPLTPSNIPDRGLELRVNRIDGEGQP